MNARVYSVDQSNQHYLMKVAAKKNDREDAN
jgi:hypothetical protein